MVNVTSGTQEEFSRRSDEEFGRICEALLKKVWKEGLPPGESAFLASQPRRVQEAIITRLQAVLDAAEGGNLRELAQTAGVEREGFFKMRKRWEREKALEVLVPNSRRNSGRRAVARPEAEAEAKAQLAMRKPSQVTAALVPITKASTPAARGLVRRAMKEMSTTPEMLQQKFGAAFALDQSVIDLPIDVGGKVELALAALLLERTSGLILGAAVGSAAFSDDVASAALELAAAYAKRERLRVLPVSGGLPELEVVIGDFGSPLNHMRFINYAIRNLGRDRVHFERKRRFGRFALEIIGNRIGRIELKPRMDHAKASAGDVAFTGKVLPVSDAALLFLREVKRYNRGIEEKLAGLGLLGGSHDGSLLLERFVSAGLLAGQAPSD